MLLSAACDSRESAEWKQIAVVAHSKPILCLACDSSDPSSPTFYTANEAVSRIDDLSTICTQIPSSQGNIRSIQVSFDGRIAFPRGTTVEIWLGSQQIMTLPHSADVSTIAWRNETLVSASASEVLVWNTLSGLRMFTFGTNGFAQGVAISFDELVVLGHSGQKYYLWSLLDGSLIEQGTVKTSASMSCSSLGQSRALIGCSDGQCFSIPIGTNGTGHIRLWGHTKNVRSVHVSKDDARGVSGSWDCTLRVWCLVTGVTLRELTDVHTAYVTAGRFFGIDDSYVVSGSSDATLRVFDLHKMDRERILALMCKPNRKSEYQPLPADVFRRVKQMLFGCALEDM